VEDNMEFACSQVAIVERLLHETLASVGRNILRPIRVSLKKEMNVCLCDSGFLRVLSPSPIFVSVALVPGSTGVPVLQVEVTQEWEVAVAAEATHITAVHDADTSAWEVVVAQNSAMIRIKDAEDQATQVEREAQERASRVDTENATVLASTSEHVEGLVRKIALLEGEHAEAHRDSWQHSCPRQ
jgi:hypothetical protein